MGFAAMARAKAASVPGGARWLSLAAITRRIPARMMKSGSGARSARLAAAVANDIFPEPFAPLRKRGCPGSRPQPSSDAVIDRLAFDVGIRRALGGQGRDRSAEAVIVLKVFPQYVAAEQAPGHLARRGGNILDPVQHFSRPEEQLHQPGGIKPAHQIA